MASAFVEGYAGPSRLFVRLNKGLSAAVKEARAVVHPHLSGIVLPKAEFPRDLIEADAVLHVLEAERGLPPGRIALLPLIETPGALRSLDAILHDAPARTLTCALGTGDLGTILGIDGARDMSPFIYARSALVMACSAAGLAPPLDGPFLRFRDQVGLVADSIVSRSLGMQGRTALHPEQVAHIHASYSGLTAEQQERYRAIVEAFEVAQASGSGAIEVDGVFVDQPIYEQAMRQLKRGESNRA
jgi:citrate lyase subunit beta/citryl-CoA lyase